MPPPCSVPFRDLARTTIPLSTPKGNRNEAEMAAPPWKEEGSACGANARDPQPPARATPSPLPHAATTPPPPRHRVPKPDQSCHSPRPQIFPRLFSLVYSPPTRAHHHPKTSRNPVPFVCGASASFIHTTPNRLGGAVGSFAASSCSAGPEHVPSGSAAAAAGMRDQAAGDPGDRAAVALPGGSAGADAGAAGAAAPLLRVLAHRAPGLVPVQVAPRRLRVGAPPPVRAGGRRHRVARRSRAGSARVGWWRLRDGRSL